MFDTEKFQINIFEKVETSKCLAFCFTNDLKGLIEIIVAALFQRLLVNLVQSLSTYTSVCTLLPLCISFFISLLGVST